MGDETGERIRGSPGGSKGRKPRRKQGRGENDGLYRRTRGPEPGEIAGRGALICEGSPGVMKGRPPPRSFSPGTEAPLLTTPICDQ